MLGQPVSMLIPEVVGFHLTGALSRGDHRHRSRPHRHPDAARQGRGRPLRRILRPGRLGALGRRPRDHRQHGARIWRDLRLLPDRPQDARIYAPDRPARGAGRAGRGLCQGAGHVARGGRRRRAGLHRHAARSTCRRVEPCLAGPKRPQDRVPALPASTRSSSPISPRNMAIRSAELAERFRSRTGRLVRSARRRGGGHDDLGHGDVVIAAITSCTNTSNPSVLVAAGLVARKARANGLESQALGEDQRSRRARKVVTDYLDQAGLQEDLDAIGFNLVGYGCTTCIGNSGPLPDADQRRDQQERPRRRLACSRATAISRAACRPTCAPIISPRRRSSSPMR